MAITQPGAADSLYDNEVMIILKALLKTTSRIQQCRTTLDRLQCQQRHLHTALGSALQDQEDRDSVDDLESVYKRDTCCTISSTFTVAELQHKIRSIYIHGKLLLSREDEDNSPSQRFLNTMVRELAHMEFLQHVSGECHGS